MRDGAHIKKRKNIFNKLQPFFCILRVYTQDFLFSRWNILSL